MLLVTVKNYKKMKDLKLFIWENVLCDYTSGIAFALAENTQEAREIIFAKQMKEDGYIGRSLTEDLASEPKIISNKEGFYIWGGG